MRRFGSLATTLGIFGLAWVVACTTTDDGNQTDPRQTAAVIARAAFTFYAAEVGLLQEEGFDVTILSDKQAAKLNRMCLSAQNLHLAMDELRAGGITDFDPGEAYEKALEVCADLTIRLHPEDSQPDTSS